MCGVAGACLRPDTRVDANRAVRLACEAMRSRGPDADGHWADPEHRIVLGHRRLAIIDLDARSDQPMRSETGRFVIVFNGEIYNYRELKRDLERQGRSFRTNGDTEVILQLVEQEGIGAVERLRGMFAFAVWDRESQTLYLARDPYGIKPLYIAKTGSGVLFASQVKALIASGVISTTVEPAGLVGFFLTGSVPEPWTIYSDVSAVPAGSWVTVRNGELETVTCYADVGRFWDDKGLVNEPRELARKVRDSVVDSVQSHLVADVPASIFLSGGVDSGAIAGVMAELGHPAEGVTIRFEEFAGARSDEAPRARHVANRYGTKHTVRTISRDEFESDLPAILHAMDQPTVDGVNTWFAAKAAAEQGYKVALSGVGGDELFCGYSSFARIPKLARAGRILGSSALVRGPARACLSLVGTIIRQPKLSAVPTLARTAEGAHYLQRALFLPHELSCILGRDLAAEGMARLNSTGCGVANLDPVQSDSWAGYIAALESTRYLRNQLLRDSDWASMAHSLELRTPLVDHVLTRSLAPYADPLAGLGKKYLAGVPILSLPSEIVDAPKSGFGLPINDWITRSKLARSWESVDLLRRAETSWARRWAHVVASTFCHLPAERALRRVSRRKKELL
jgi:asparagine synthase (glutamine-hydrolysing)